MLANWEKVDKAALSIVALFSICLGAWISMLGFAAGLVFAAILLAIPVVYIILLKPQVGVCILIIVANTWALFGRMGIQFPLGTILDALIALMLLSFLLLQKSQPQWNIYKTPIAIATSIWILYNFLEIVNPIAESRLAWLYTIRTIAVVTLTYFAFLRIIDKISFLRLVIKWWLFLSVIAALYAFKQEFFGFSAGEEAYLNSDPRLTELYYIAGHWRKFSIFADPVTFAYNMVISALLCFALMTGKLSKNKKLILAFLGIMFSVAMLYSGTRGAYVLLPAGFLLFSILRFNKKILFSTALIGAATILLIKIPSSNPTIVRFQSAFRPSQDASFNLRETNQKKIQPYILTHPIGGGLGATGTWGQRFSPNSYLANFPPDSGYVRVAVEQGWIGLLIYCLLIFIILKTGITNYYLIKNKELKSYCLAMTLIIFVLNIGNFPQEAFVQYPSNIYFYLAAALINETLLLDQDKLRNQQKA